IHEPVLAVPPYMMRNVMGKYRLYIDEVGNSDLGASTNPNHRYLSLTGIIIELTYVQHVVFPMIEKFKNTFFTSHPDEPIILHRKELVNKLPPFDNLRNPGVELAFNQALLEMLRNLDYVVLTIVIDKLEHCQRYQTWRFDPYHYCLTVLVERYVKWLQAGQAVGDVLAESRGGKEDRRLKDSFARVYEKGSEYIHPEEFAKYLTSSQLKVKPKISNIAGLQLADLLAYPSYRATLARYQNEALDANFGGKIAEILESGKYYRSPNGKIDGWGRKWLP
ncbi:MAG: DUF3800 domain-containing protein, partial [Chloroflexi bacterium]|nr:DUF3800 domain-containing protein [Chloroflexota bacterium]